MKKDTAPDELINAVNIILSGRRYFNHALAERMTSVLGEREGLLPHELLSEREFQVLLKLAAGFSVSEIAGQLNVSSSTVSTYRMRILEKMDIKTNADIIRYVEGNKFL